jgi:hypothetical protein
MKQMSQQKKLFEWLVFQTEQYLIQLAAVIIKNVYENKKCEKINKCNEYLSDNNIRLTS